MTNQQYIDGLSKRLSRLRGQLADLEYRANHADTQSGLPSYGLLMQLRERERAVQQMLQELSLAEEDASDKLRTGVDSAWKDLEAAFESVREMFDAASEKVAAGRS